MAVFRVNRNKNYTHMANYHFREKEMSLKAKGLLSLMLSLPDEWDYSANGLATLSKDGKDSIKKTLVELEQFGYLKRTRATDSKGRFVGYDYDIFEKPTTGKPVTEKPLAENPSTENPPQLNTKGSSTNQSSTNEVSTKQDIYPFDEFWSAYPKKKAKEAAKKISIRIPKLKDCKYFIVITSKRTEISEYIIKEIIQAVIESAKTKDWLKENGKYIPYPATYLNGKRWEDERNESNGQNTGNPRKVQYGTVL